VKIEGEGEGEREREREREREGTYFPLFIYLFFNKKVTANLVVFPFHHVIDQLFL
jgi:hypothetical protein